MTLTSSLGSEHRLLTRAARNRERGITLIEMLVVVVIIGLFVGLVGVNVIGLGDKTKPVAAKTQITNLQNALGVYKLDTGSYPPTELGLTALLVKPEGVANWRGPYLDRDIPLDPWQRPYLYKFPGDHGDAPDLKSLGADGQEGGEGNDADVLSWR